MAGKTNSGARESLELRLREIAAAVGRRLAPHPPVERTPQGQYRHLLEETQELYENELIWGEEEEEDAGEEAPRVELAFPGTLALVDALATSHTPGREGEGAPHRDVVLGFLSWLVERVFSARSSGTAAGTPLRERRIEVTERLIDQVAYRYLGLDDEERARLESRFR